MGQPHRDRSESAAKEVGPKPAPSFMAGVQRALADKCVAAAAAAARHQLMQFARARACSAPGFWLLLARACAGPAAGLVHVAGLAHAHKHMRACAHAHRAVVPSALARALRCAARRLPHGLGPSIGAPLKGFTKQAGMNAAALGSAFGDIAACMAAMAREGVEGAVHVLEWAWRRK